MTTQSLKPTASSPGLGATRWFNGLRMPRNLSDRWLAVLLFLPPAVIVFTLFVIFPVGEASVFSFFHWNGYGPQTDFVGLENFARVFHHHYFWIALRNSLLVIAVSLFVQLPLALALALGVARPGVHNSVLRLIFFLPFILAEVAAGLIWSFVFDGNYGLVAKILPLFGLDNIYILSDPNYALAAILVVVVWKYFGFHMMIYIAALQGVPDELVEAAHLDGANRWHIIRHIKIPHIIPAIKVSIFFSVLGALQLFDVIIPLTGGGPLHSTNSIVSYLYQFGITRMNVGFGSAVALILFVLCVGFAVLYQRFIMRRRDS